MYIEKDLKNESSNVRDSFDRLGNVVLDDEVAENPILALDEARRRATT